MKKTVYFFILFLVISTLSLQQGYAQDPLTGIFVGGNIYYGRDFAVKELKRSGFNTAIIWTIHVDQNGNLNFNQEFPLIQDGEYIGDRFYPKFREDVAALKEAPTSITRVEFGLSAWQSPTYTNIKNLVNSDGVGPDSKLYKNFKVLRETFPTLDGLNNDDEGEYDVPSAVAFTKMCASLGFKNSIVPYTANEYWSDLVEQVNAEYPGNIDATFLQVYAGGAGNNPCSSSWDFGIPVYPGLWGSVEGGGQLTPSEVESRMNSWNTNCSDQVNGGFLWLYNDFKQSPDVVAFANALRKPFGISDEGPVMAYNPSPASNTEEVRVDKQLTWTGGRYDAKSKVYFGTSSMLGNIDFQEESTEGVFNPGTLENNTTYYWRIDEENAFGGPITGETWSFTTEVTTPLPDVAINLLPANKQEDERGRPRLEWDFEDRAISYDIHFGTENPPLFLVNQVETFIDIDRLEPLTTYYWQIFTVNSVGKTAGEIWSFNTEDANIALGAVPTSSSDFSTDYSKDKMNDDDLTSGGEWASNGESTPWAKLTWGNEVEVKKVILYDRPNGVDNIFTGMLEFSDGTQLEVGALPTTGLGLEIDVEDIMTETVEFKVLTSEGLNIGLLEFEVLGVDSRFGFPDSPRNYVPGDGEGNIKTNFIVRWLGSSNATSYNVYLGENEVISPEDLLGNVTNNRYENAPLQEGKTYHWRVDAVNDKGITEGPVFSFSTEEVLSTSFDEANFIIYPNPSNDLVTIDLTNFENPYIQLILFSGSGKRIFEQKIDSNRQMLHLNLERFNLDNGIYNLHFIDGDKKFIQKLILK